MENHPNGTSQSPISFLKKGAMFPSKGALTGACFRLNFSQARNYKLIQNRGGGGYFKINCVSASASRFEGKEGICQFHMYAKTEKISGTETGNWIVYKIHGSHSCSQESCKRKAHDKHTVSALSSSLQDYVPNKKSRGGSIRQVIDLARMSAGLEMKKSQAAAIVQDKRDDSIEKHIGQYFLMESYIESLKDADPNGTFVLDKHLCPWDHSCYQFNRVYVSFSHTREVWKESSMKLLVADGTFTTSGIFRQTILLAVTMDGNRNLVLLAYSVCSKENQENWVWFLQKIIRDYPRARIFQSDYDKGVESGEFQQVLANNNIYFAWCVKHMVDNCGDATGAKLSDRVANQIYTLARARTVDAYNTQLERLSQMNQAAAHWFNARKHLFATYLFVSNGWYRYGNISNNFAEQFNHVIKDWKTLPILSFCVKLNEYCCDMYYKRHIQAIQWATEEKEFTHKIQEDHYIAIDDAAQRYFTQ